jgi:outer membrane protein OmpA-like peptidoglycan-associated protein
LENFTRVIALDKDNGNAYYERALIHLYMLHNEEGQRDMEHAARLGHNGAQVWLRSQRQKEAARGEKTAVDEQKSTSADVSVLHFEYNEATIKPSYIPLLESIGSDIQRSLAKITIVVTGHTDSTGSDSFNHHLSMRRAQAVKKYLTETYQIPPELISIEAYGESIPLAPNTSETNRALNRRVEITGIP